jgi:hypothetical protein
MKNKGGILKNLSLIGCIAAMILLVTPAVSAEVFFPPPYSMNIIPGQYPVYQGFISGFSGSFVQPVEAVPSYTPRSLVAGIIDYPTGTLYPVNPLIVNPAITGSGSVQQTFGAYYTGSGTRSSGSGGAGARFMCSL